ncbi:hypothetical protein LT493_03980 [Streptomyces tricolor]|nr:hypothetical protein [Streptomyces tricolor]
MSVLFGLVALVGLLCVRDLVLCVGAMQRLVEQAEQPARAGRDPASCLARGGRVHPFRTVTTEGVPLDREQLLDDTAVAFFLPGCTRCRERLPGFLEYARGLPGGRRQALAVVVGAAGGGGRVRRPARPRGTGGRRGAGRAGVAGLRRHPLSVRAPGRPRHVGRARRDRRRPGPRPRRCSGLPRCVSPSADATARAEGARRRGEPYGARCRPA